MTLFYLQRGILLNIKIKKKSYTFKTFFVFKRFKSDTILFTMGAYAMQAGKCRIQPAYGGYTGRSTLHNVVRRKKKQN